MTDKIDKRKQPGWCPNPTGKGGFKERPQDINAGGFTSEQKAQHKINRDKALGIEERWLSAVETLIEFAGEDAHKVIDTLNTDTRQMVNTAVERYDGKATQRVDNNTTINNAPKGLDAFYASLDGDVEDE